jgi:hypothetical protein
MKKLFFYSLIVLILSACQNREEEKSSTEKTTPATVPVEKRTVAVPYTAAYNEQTQTIELKRTTKDDLSKTSPQEMIDAINLKYPQIQLALLSGAPGSIHVKIADSNYLTETIGTAGAKIFLAETTYALTEINGIKNVSFDFAEGNHASPGVYTRADFKDL